MNYQVTPYVREIDNVYYPEVHTTHPDGSVDRVRFEIHCTSRTDAILWAERLTKEHAEMLRTVVEYYIRGMSL